MIKYVNGDATSPIGEGKKIIVHICNDRGAWGAGFVLAISRKWEMPEAMYRTMNNRQLGAIQLVEVESDIYVANMIGQHNTGFDENGLAPIRYDAVLECLRKVSKHAKELNASIHMPRIGCGLAGGEWSVIEKIVNEALAGIDVTVYDFK